MRRDRLEDLGRISALLEAVMDDEGWDWLIKHGNEDGIIGWFYSQGRESQEEFLRLIAQFAHSLHHRLSTISILAEGDDRTNSNSLF